MATTRKKKISDYTLDQQNINKGSEKGNSLLEKSLREVGAARSVVSDKNGVMISGNKTMEKAAELGFEDVLEVETDGKTLVVVKRIDLDITTEQGIKAKILDNTVQRHNYVEDAEVVQAICEEHHIEAAQYGLTLREFRDNNDADEPSGYDQQGQWFLNIRCDSEQHCQQLYEKLIGEGLDVKIVT